MAAGRIVIAGLGIRGPEQVTPEVARALRESDVVFHSVAHDVTRQWIESLAPRTHDLNLLYRDGEQRIDTYRAMAAAVVEAASAGATVAFVVYGHPCVLHTGVQLAMRLAAERSLPVRMLPGLSSIDGLLAAVGVDFGFGGLHVLEASDLVMHGRMPQTEAHVVILQVALTGPRVHRAQGHRGDHADYLIRRLRTLYPLGHAALHFRLASSASEDDALVWTTVERLHAQAWTNASSLYLPPARTSRVDGLYAQRFGSRE